MLKGTPARIGEEWGGVRLTDPAEPGDVVTVVTKGGKKFSRRLVSVHKRYEDAIIWVAEEVNKSEGPKGSTETKERWTLGDVLAATRAILKDLDGRLDDEKAAASVTSAVLSLIGAGVILPPAISPREKPKEADDPYEDMDIAVDDDLGF